MALLVRKKCVLCGTEFQTSIKQTKYCSVECSEEMNRRRARERYHKNPEKILAYMYEYRAKFPEKRKQYDKKYRETHREQRAESSRKYRAARREQYNGNIK